MVATDNNRYGNPAAHWFIGLLTTYLPGPANDYMTLVNWQTMFRGFNCPPLEKDQYYHSRCLSTPNSGNVIERAEYIISAGGDAIQITTPEQFDDPALRVGRRMRSQQRHRLSPPYSNKKNPVLPKGRDLLLFIIAFI